MPSFKYKARDDDGHQISGKVEVANEEELRRRIESSGFFLVECAQERGGLLGGDLFQKFQKVGIKDLYKFTVQLHNTVGTGVPLLTSLQTIILGSQNKKMVRVINEVIDDLREGSSLSKAFKKHPKVFSDFYVSMVELGESSGKLAETIGSLATYIKRDMEIKQRIGAAMAYPVCVAVLGSGIVTYILVCILPQFIDVFAKEKAALPLPTMLLIGLSNAVTHYWYVLIIVIISAIISFRFLLKTEMGHLFFDRLALRAPVIGSVIKKICAKRFIDGLYLLQFWLH